MSTSSEGSWLHRVVKPVAERISAVLLLVMAAPVVAAAALLVRLTSRGPAFYTQVRVGRDGRPFTLFKIRTMRVDCEKTTGPQWAVPSDPRITPIGRILRETHVDELPQLVNVLRGEMSLVGPRPERPEFCTVLEAEIDGYRDRLAVLPGITGLAQVHLPPDVDLESVRRKLAYDLHYIDHASFLLEVKIVLCTLGAACGLQALWLHRVLGLPTVERPMAPAAAIVERKAAA
ncbi:MAG: sugar transferase [Planctomycetia bacterium]